MRSTISTAIINGLLNNDPKILNRVFGTDKDDKYCIFGMILAAYKKTGAFHSPLMIEAGYDDPVSMIALIYEKLTPEVVMGIDDFFSYVSITINNTIRQIADPARHKKFSAELANLKHLSDKANSDENCKRTIEDTVFEIVDKSKSQAQCDVEFHAVMHAKGMTDVSRAVIEAKNRGLSSKEIAAALGLSQNNVDVISSRARKIMAHEYRTLYAE